MGRAARFAILGLVAASFCLPASASAASGSPGPANHWVRSALRARHLQPNFASCAGGPSSWRCHWRATRDVSGWTFACHGRAERSGGRSSIGRCHLQGPGQAPLLSADSIGPSLPAFGFNEDWLTQIGHLDLAGGAGANISRVPFRWDVIEPQRGQFDWSGYDQVYNAMAYRGIKPILAIDGSPCWARPGTPCSDTHYPPAARYYGEWARFIQLAVRRYPRLEGVEIWNEPNLNEFWRPRADPKAYARLLKVSYKAVKAIQPTLPVVFGGLVPQFAPSTRAMGVRNFQRRAYRAGAAKYTDAFAVHPYVFPNDDPNLFTAIRVQMAIPKDIAAQFGHPGTPLWVTEFGVSSKGAGAVSESEQASKIVFIYQLLRRIPNTPVLVLHRLLDLPEGDWQAGMGVATANGALKPSYCAIAVARTGHCPYG